MKKIGKILSAGLSLTLCAALVVPSFAASFTDLQNAIDGKDPVASFTREDKTYYGYGSKLSQDGEDMYAIEAWDDAETGRNVKLNEDVTFQEEDKEPAKATAEEHNVPTDGIIIDGKGEKVTLDLNGQTIDLNPGAELDAEAGAFKDADGAEIDDDELNKGSVITVTNGAELTINDSSAETCEYGGEEHVIAGSGTGTITGGDWRKPKPGDWPNQAGGISVSNGSKLTMNGGNVVGNWSREGNGGGICIGGNAWAGTNVVRLDGVVVSGNRTKYGSGGIYACYNFDVGMNGCVVEGNGGSGVLFIEPRDENWQLANRECVVTNTISCGNNDEWQFRDFSKMVSLSGEEDEKGFPVEWIYADKGYHNLNDLTEKELKGLLDAYVKLETVNKTVTNNTENGTREGDIVTTYTCAQCGETLAVLKEHFVPGATTTTTIDDPEVPLAGLFTRGDAIGYLWEQAGSPEAELSTFPDVPEDHQWAVAIGWAEDMGIALPDLEGNFRPDDLVLRSVEGLEASPEGELQEFLNRYAAYAGIELAEDELFIELAGAWDDVIMGEEAQEIFDGFFAQLEAALAQAA